MRIYPHSRNNSQSDSRNCSQANISAQSLEVFVSRYRGGSRTECTKIAHRRSLAIFTAEGGIAGNSAARTIFTHFLRRRNRGSLAIFFAEEIAHLGASKNRAIVWGAVKIAAAAAENRAILVHSVPARQT